MHGIEDELGGGIVPLVLTPLPQVEDDVAELQGKGMDVRRGRRGESIEDDGRQLLGGLRGEGVECQGLEDAVRAVGRGAGQQAVQEGEAAVVAAEVVEQGGVNVGIRSGRGRGCGLLGAAAWLAQRQGGQGDGALVGSGALALPRVSRRGGPVLVAARGRGHDDVVVVEAVAEQVPGLGGALWRGCRHGPGRAAGQGEVADIVVGEDGVCLGRLAVAPQPVQVGAQAGRVGGVRVLLVGQLALIPAAVGIVAAAEGVCLARLGLQLGPEAVGVALELCLS